MLDDSTVPRSTELKTALLLISGNPGCFALCSLEPLLSAPPLEGSEFTAPEPLSLCIESLSTVDRMSHRTQELRWSFTCLLWSWAQMFKARHLVHTLCWSHFAWLPRLRTVTPMPPWFMLWFTSFLSPSHLSFLTSLFPSLPSSSFLLSPSILFLPPSLLPFLLLSLNKQ